jgi:hypothetical protein
MDDKLDAFDDQHGYTVLNALAVYAERMRETAEKARAAATAPDPDPSDLRSWPMEDLLILARATGQLWDSTGRGDPYDVLSDRQRQLMDLAAAGYLVAEQDGRDAGEYLRLAAATGPGDTGTGSSKAISLRPTADGWTGMAQVFDESADHADRAHAAYETLTGRDDDGAGDPA